MQLLIPLVRSGRRCSQGTVELFHWNTNGIIKNYVIVPKKRTITKNAFLKLLKRSIKERIWNKRSLVDMNGLDLFYQGCVLNYLEIIKMG